MVLEIRKLSLLPYFSQAVFGDGIVALLGECYTLALLITRKGNIIYEQSIFTEGIDKVKEI